MSQDDRFAAAALMLQAQRESIADVRSAIAAVLSAGDPLDGRDTPTRSRPRGTWRAAPSSARRAPPR